MINRRSLITGLISFVAAPAIVRVESLMPVKVYRQPTQEERQAVFDAITKSFSQEWEKHIADAILYGSSYGLYSDASGLYGLLAKDIYIDHS
jgi:hypothetical protein